MACPEGQYFCNDRQKCMPIPKGKKVRKDGELVSEVAPPGFGHTKGDKEKGVKRGGTAAAFDRARKEGRFKGSKSDMFAIMWSQKNKGDKPHYKPGTNKKYKKYQEEETSCDSSYEKLKKKIGSKKKHKEPVVVEGIGDAVKKGVKRHKDAVEKKKIKNRKAVPYAALAAQHEPEGDMIDEACWKGYKAYGMKKKGNRMVPNCKPIGSVKKEELAIEAKVDTGTPEEKEKARNVRKFGVSHNVAGHGKLRRALHRSDRGDKKIKGDKSQYVEMESAVNEGIGRAIKKGVKIAKRVVK